MLSVRFFSTDWMLIQSRSSTHNVVPVCLISALTEKELRVLLEGLLFFVFAKIILNSYDFENISNASRIIRFCLSKAKCRKTGKNGEIEFALYDIHDESRPGMLKSTGMIIRTGSLNSR